MHPKSLIIPGLKCRQCRLQTLDFLTESSQSFHHWELRVNRFSNLRFAPGLQCALYLSLHLTSVCILAPGLQSAVPTLRFTLTLVSLIKLTKNGGIRGNGTSTPLDSTIFKRILPAPTTGFPYVYLEREQQISKHDVCRIYVRCVNFSTINLFCLDI